MWLVDDRPRTVVVYQQRPGCLRGCFSIGCTSIFAALVAVVMLVLGIAFVAALFR